MSPARHPAVSLSVDVPERTPGTTTADPTPCSGQHPPARESTRYAQADKSQPPNADQGGTAGYTQASPPSRDDSIEQLLKPSPHLDDQDP